jgi:hypothetical protein
MLVKHLLKALDAESIVQDHVTVYVILSDWIVDIETVTMMAAYLSNFTT